MSSGSASFAILSKAVRVFALRSRVVGVKTRVASLRIAFGCARALITFRVAHLEVLEGLRERGLRSWIVRLGEKLHEIGARLVVQTACSVLLGQRVDDRVEQLLDFRRARIVASPRHGVLVKLRQALD